jgi:DNA invertase Pin-like site-specific DNA recombinase
VFDKKKVHLVSLKENLDTSTPVGKLMLTMIGAINEFERANLLERQREGIAIAKAQGKYKGKQMVIPKDFDKLYAQYMRREIPSKAELCRRLNISRPKLDRIIKSKLDNNVK